MITPKMDIAFKITTFIIKRGLFFTEKNVWRNRRRILSKVFNFDLIRSQIPTMKLTADKVFEAAEEISLKTNPEGK